MSSRKHISDYFLYSPLINKKTILTSYEAARQLRETILEDASAAGFSDTDLFSIRLAIEEALTNSIKHGNKLNEDKKLDISWECSGKELKIIVSDEGEGFDPGDVSDPTLSENLDRPYGRGIMLIRSYMDDVSYNSKGNTIIMVKRNSFAGS